MTQPTNRDMSIWVTFQLEGLHRYPEAATNPALATGDDMDVSFLAHPHRHIFHFRVSMSVSHTNRDVEFIQLKRQLLKLYGNSTLTLDYKSCEMIADELHAQLAAMYGTDRAYTIEVSEDGENGCLASYPAQSEQHATDELVQYKRMDISAVTEGIIAHGVNCVGVMGSGVARVLRDKYPSIFTRYSSLCKTVQAEDLLGKVDSVIVNKYPHLEIANCFTQELFGFDRAHAQVEYVESALRIVFERASITGMNLYIPKIGAGRGGLDWDKDIEPIVSKLAAKFGHRVTVCVWEE